MCLVYENLIIFPNKTTAPPSFYSENSLRGASSQQHVASVPDFFDPNFDVDATWLGWCCVVYMLLATANDVHVEDDSPYPEVRAAVANFDDDSMPVTTLRAWLFGILWAMILPGINQFFYFRFPTINVTSVRLYHAVDTRH